MKRKYLKLNDTVEWIEPWEDGKMMYQGVGKIYAFYALNPYYHGGSNITIPYWRRYKHDNVRIKKICIVNERTMRFIDKQNIKLVNYIWRT